MPQQKTSKRARPASGNNNRRGDQRQQEQGENVRSERSTRRPNRREQDEI